MVKQYQDLCQGNRFTTTLHAINSAILKLARLARATTVYRGISGGVLPSIFFQPDEFNVRGAVEYGFVRWPHIEPICTEDRCVPLPELVRPATDEHDPQPRGGGRLRERRARDGGRDEDGHDGPRGGARPSRHLSTPRPPPFDSSLGVIIPVASVVRRSSAGSRNVRARAHRLSRSPLTLELSACRPARARDLLRPAVRARAHLFARRPQHDRRGGAADRQPEGALDRAGGGAHALQAAGETQTRDHPGAHSPRMSAVSAPDGPTRADVALFASAAATCS